jgi:hypothetical protein
MRHRAWCGPHDGDEMQPGARVPWMPVIVLALSRQDQKDLLD